MPNIKRAQNIPSTKVYFGDTLASILKSRAKPTAAMAQILAQRPVCVEKGPEEAEKKAPKQSPSAESIRLSYAEYVKTFLASKGL